MVSPWVNEVQKSISQQFWVGKSRRKGGGGLAWHVAGIMNKGVFKKTVNKILRCFFSLFFFENIRSLVNLNLLVVLFIQGEHGEWAKFTVRIFSFEEDQIWHINNCFFLNCAMPFASFYNSTAYKASLSFFPPSLHFSFFSLSPLYHYLSPGPLCPLSPSISRAPPLFQALPFSPVFSSILQFSSSTILSKLFLIRFFLHYSQSPSIFLFFRISRMPPMSRSFFMFPAWQTAEWRLQHLLSSLIFSRLWLSLLACQCPPCARNTHG